MKWEERQGILDDLQKIGENPNPHRRSTGGTTEDVLRQQGVIAKALLLLLDPPIIGDGLAREVIDYSSSHGLST